MTRCGEIMTKDPVICPPSTTLINAASMMRDQDTGVLPIAESDYKLMGVITDRDIVVRGLAENRDPQNTRVADIMSEEVQTCRTNDEVEAAMDRMSQAQVRRIPVVNDENKIIGIISQGDIALRVDKAKEVGRVVEDVSRPDESAL